MPQLKLEKWGNRKDDLFSPNEFQESERNEQEQLSDKVQVQSMEASGTDTRLDSSRVEGERTVRQVLRAKLHFIQFDCFMFCILIKG